ncbi:hypothetical protein R69776_04810 [Paraburkholderia nemoris]|uniref:MFS transporter n=2 Tax=Paraburkholderia nemoris TaxID=2793076 RepID=A0ABN7M8Z6_9BURK|nr:hypothetical protein R69776_04810 [Paraburkholderia nemoris]
MTRDAQPSAARVTDTAYVRPAIACSVVRRLTSSEGGVARMLIAGAGAAVHGLIACAGTVRGLMASVGWAARALMASMGGAARRLTASMSGAACVLLASGAATLVTQAGLGQRANALWMSALALATMAIVPLLMSRVSRTHSTLATAVTLIATMSAMGVVPAYAAGLEHSTAIAGLFVVVGGVALLYGQHLVGAQALPPEDFDRNQYADQNTDQSPRTIRVTGATVLLALFAGLSSGSLARFQLYAICGMSGTQPMLQILLSVGTVCALAFIADRPSNNNRMLIVLYVLRAAVIGALAVVDSPSLALLAAKIFLILDCLTIPALMKLRRKSRSALSAGCPGAAHHIGMVLGATLSTTPYFFGDGFIVLYALSAIANLICAGTLATNWFEKKVLSKHLNHHSRQADSSDEHKVQVGKYDSLVTNAECGRTQIPDAPLPEANHSAHLAGVVLSRFLLPTFLCGGKEK